MRYDNENFKMTSLYCFKIVVTGLIYIVLFVIPKNGQAQEIIVTGTVLYNPKMSECFRKTPCTRAIELTRTEDWIPPKSSVNIAVKGTDRVVKTDRNGNYDIYITSPNDTLVFMYVGHNRIYVPVNGRDLINIKLTPTPLPIIDRVLGLITPKVTSGRRPDIDVLAKKAEVNRETVRDFLWLVLGTRPFSEAYPDEYISDYTFK